MKDNIIARVVTKISQRSEVGIKKYKTTLDRNDLTLRQWLQHLQEELMDGMNYSEKLLSILPYQFPEQREWLREFNQLLEDWGVDNMEVFKYSFGNRELAKKFLSRVPAPLAAMEAYNDITNAAA